MSSDDDSKKKKNTRPNSENSNSIGFSDKGIFSKENSSTKNKLRVNENFRILDEKSQKYIKKVFEEDEDNEENYI